MKRAGAVLMWLVLLSALLPGSVAAACAPAAEAARQLRCGSVPVVLGALAGAWRDGFAAAQREAAVAYPQPYGPPQGRLDPQLAGFLRGALDFAFLTRDLAEADLATFGHHHGGGEPLRLPVAGGSWNRFGHVDPVAVIVHVSNPLPSLDLAQLEAVFAEGGADISRWEQLGVQVWSWRPIRLAGGGAWQAEESARALFLRRHVFARPASARGWRAAPDSGDESDNVQRVAADPQAIAFTGLGHLLPGTRALPIAPHPGAAPVVPDRESVASGRYPLTRTVDLLLPRDARGGIDPVMVRFAAFLLSDAGQAIVAAQEVFLPLDECRRRQSLAWLAAGWSPQRQTQCAGE